MKQFIRTLSMLVCMALLMTSIPVDALAEAAALEDLVIVQQTAEAAAQEDEDAPEATAEPQAESAEAEPAPESEDGGEAEASADSPDEIQDLPVEQAEEEGIDYSADASVSPAFVLGYAQILRDETALYSGSASDSQLLARLGAGVVYATGRSQDGARLEITYHSGAQLQSGWVDAACLRPMNPEDEVPAYLLACAGDETALALVDGVLLCAIVYAPAEEAGEETETEIETEAESDRQEMTFLTALAELTAQENTETESETQTEIELETLQVGASLRASTLDMAIGEEIDLPASGVLTGVSDGDQLTFENGDASVLSVDANGRICALSQGAAVVGVRVNGGEAMDLLVTVYPVANEIALSLPATMGVGSSAIPAVSFPAGSYAAWTLSSNHPEIIGVGEDGSVIAHQQGSATITATTAGGASASVEVTALAAPERISISVASQQLYVGNAGETIVGICPDGAMCSFLYESSNNAVATVDAQGNVQAVGVGEAVITVTADNNSAATASCTIQVFRAPASLRLKADTLNIGIGDSFDMKNLLEVDEGSKAEYTFSSGNAKYATVTSDGIVKGLKRGLVYINASTQNGLKAQLLLCVNYLAVSSAMTLSPASLTLGVGETAQASVSFASGYYGLYEFVSSNDQVATVSADGCITAAGKGEATITARLIQNPNVKKSISVAVKTAPEAIAASVSRLELGVGQVSQALYGICTDANTACGFRYESGNDQIVMVDSATGAITAVSQGETTITITADNNPAATAVCTVSVQAAPTGLAARKDALTIGWGDSYDIEALFEVQGGDASALSFASSHPAYVSVDENGKITALRAGLSFITASTYNGLSARILVTAGYIPTASRIAFSPASLTLGAGATGKFTVWFASGYGALYTLSSSNEKVATVDSEGNVTAVGAGTATITAALVQNPAITKSAVVTVKAAPETISVSRESLMLNVGQTSSAVYGVNPDSANTACNFAYSSSDEAVAVVDPDTGAITAVGVGRAQIKVCAANNPEAAAECTVTVVGLDTGVLYLGLGDVCDLKARISHPDGKGAGEYTFASSNWRYVAASADGVLTALRVGSVWVTVASADGLWQRILVTVRYYPGTGSMSISPMQLSLGEGMNGQLSVSFPYGYAGLYSLSSSREDVATVDETGKVAAVGTGETVITATLVKNPAVTASARVQVLAAPERIEASLSSLELGVGQVSAALQGVCPDSGAACDFIYESGNEQVAIVDSSTGAITAVGVGEAVITITAGNNPAAKATCTVTVKPAPATLTLKSSVLNIGIGDSFDMKELLEVNAGSKAEYTFATGNAKYATVTSDGVVKGLKRGMVYITATTQNGLKAQLLLCINYLPNASLMTLTPTELTLCKGMNAKASVSFRSGYYGLYEFASSNDQVAAVSADGEITAVDVGEATITASLVQNPSVKKSISVSVKSAPDNIQASVSSLKLGVGQVSAALQGVCPPEAMCEFIYTSSNEAAVQVDSTTGVLTAVGAGEATITIAASNNPAATASCTVTVGAAPTAIRLNQSALTIGVGDSYDIRSLFEVEGGSVETLSFTSSHPGYVSVSEDGTIRGLRFGASFITAQTYNGLSARILVSVYYLPTAGKMSLVSDQLTLGEGMTGQLAVKFASAYCGVIAYSSEDEDVATVDPATGTVTAVGAGTATIRASLAQNPAIYKTASVQVLPAPERISATESYIRLGVGQQSSALQGVCPDGAMCSFVYTSSNENVVRVDAATGALTAVGKGVATVTIAAGNNPQASASCKLVVLDAPLQMELEKSSIYIGYGDRYDLKELICTTAGSAAGYTFATSNKNYVSVSEDGVIQGLRAGGIVTITVKTHNGLSDTIKVSVMFKPTKISVTPDALTMGVGMQETLAVAFNSAYYYSVHTFSSSAPNVVSVDHNGVVTARDVGEATITVETYNGLKDEVQIRVLPGTQKIEFAQAEYSLSTNMQLATSLQVDEDSLDAYIYESSDEGVVTIDANGVLTGVKKGTATIRVRTASGVASTQECKVTVTAVPHSLDFNGMPEMAIALGYSVKLPQPYALDEEGDPVAASFTYSFPWSLYAKYARIDGDTICGLAAGKVLVRATSHNGLSIDFAVRIVNDTVAGVQLDYSSYTLYIDETTGDSVALNGKVLGTQVEFGAPSYRSDNEDVATVSSDGVVTAVGTGTATITAEAYTGITATCEITVGRLTGSVAFESDAHTLTAGDIWQLTPVFDANTGARMQYESSDKAVAVVDEDGNVTAIGPGSATITAKTQNGLTVDLALKVRAVPVGIRLNVMGLNLAAGESVVLQPEILRDASLGEEIEVDTTVLYASSDKAVASVSADGAVTAVSQGEAVITAETCNGLQASCTVTVLKAGSLAVTEFAFSTATMIQGDSASLKFNLSKEAYERGFTIQSSDTEKLLVDSSDWTITAAGAAEEGVELTLTINPSEGEAAAAEADAGCTVKIIPESKISFSAEEISLQRSAGKSSATLEILDLPEDLIGTFELCVQDEAVASYDLETRCVQAMDLVAETYVICRVFDREISCLVKVLPSYRALIISEYNNSKYTSSNLPFAQSNVDAMNETLDLSLIDGQLYDVTVLSSNPTQAQIASTISKTFADARDGDISLVYIVSHGYYNSNGVSGYCFGTPGWSADDPDSYITAAELYGWLDAIQGNVVLMLDSCRSGGFILDNASALIADGNIAVITAQTYNKNASYFVKADGSSIEFLTYALCWGLGYDYENGVPTGSLAADSNKNGEVTITECFQFAKSATTSLVKSKSSYFYPTTGMGFLVPGVWSTTALKSWGGQVPQIYIPSSMANLVLYAQ